MTTSNIKAILKSDIHKVWDIVLKNEAFCKAFFKKATGAVCYGFKEGTCPSLIIKEDLCILD